MSTNAHTEQLPDTVAQGTPAATAAPDSVPVPEQQSQHTAYTAPPQYGAPQNGAQQHAAAQQLPGQHSYGFAIASFVIGIASVVAGWTLVAPAVGLVLGILALRRNTTERTLALWGVWMNGAILAFAAMGILLFTGLASLGLFTGALAGLGW